MAFIGLAFKSFTFLLAATFVLFAAPVWAQQKVRRITIIGDSPAVITEEDAPPEDNSNKSNAGSYTNYGSNSHQNTEPSVDQCAKEFSRALPNEDQKKFVRVCKFSSTVRGVMTEKYQSPAWDARKSDYLQCLEINNKLGSPEDSYLVDCADAGKSNRMLIGNYTKCVQNRRIEFGITKSYSDCQDLQIQSNSQSSSQSNSQDYNRCKSVMQSLGQSQDRINSKCSDYYSRDRIVSKAFESCQGIMQAQKMQGSEVLDFCSSDSVVQAMGTQGFVNCQVAAAQVTNNPFNRIALCANSQTQEALPKNPKCYEQALKGAYKFYPFYTFVNKQYLDKTYFHYLARDCQNPAPAIAASNAYLKFIKDLNLHTHETMPFPDRNKPHVPVGGISALAYDSGDEMLYLLSDETRLATQLPPRLYTYKLNQKLELVDQKILPLVFGNNETPDIDPEGLVLLQNGSFIISSEVGKNQSEGSLQSGLRLTNLNIFDPTGLYFGSLPLPESFKSKGSNSGDQNNSRGGGDNRRSNSRYNDFSQIMAGLEFNKSLESLSVSPDESVLFTANEASLVQDGKIKGKCTSGFSPVCGDIVRIARYHRQEKGPYVYTPAEEFKYELEPEYENGITEILALSPNTILTLERSWDSVKQKVTSRIFKVILDKSSLIPANANADQVSSIKALKKTLVLDLDAIVPQLSAGFKVLDNFEGMGFGPTLENGNKTLLLVSDNNYSVRQRTALLFFEILPELLRVDP